jgi:transposase
MPGTALKAAPRVFTPMDRERIIAAYENAATPAERAAVMRREGVYTSHITNWRKMRKSGKSPESKTGRRLENPDGSKIARLEAKVERLTQQLARANDTIDVLGKVHALLQNAAGESAMDEQPSKPR